MATDGLFLPPQILGAVCWGTEGVPRPSDAALDVLAAPDDADRVEAGRRLAVLVRRAARGARVADLLASLQFVLENLGVNHA